MEARTRGRWMAKTSSRLKYLYRDVIGKFSFGEQIGSDINNSCHSASLALIFSLGYSQLSRAIVIIFTILFHAHECRKKLFDIPDSPSMSTFPQEVHFVLGDGL